ncbi:major tail protein [Aminipila luticellarii]|uniref:Carbohydrate binding X2 domain-containing protein n=1 Tax=Aminipila luticellarii TaxID=2507160 RepID=A0A410PX49_9FIRM|nr:major tail protein [Aminipila luticellarii]QAT43440.1 hypothetical protein EQM06_09555 [Aminipila luticellarii]
MGNKVKFGLKNVHYAVVMENNDIVTYGTPKAMPGAVNLVQNSSGDPVTFYADDTAYFEENTNNGYEGTLEMALIPDEFRVDVLGDEIDANGALIENADAKPNKIALMFEFDGDQKKTRHVNYRVSVARPNIEGSTKTNTKEPKTETLNITVRPALDTSDVKTKIEQGQTGYDTFYSAVYLKNAVINTAASTAATFSKAAPDDLAIDVTSSAADNAVKNVKLDGTWIPGIHLTVSGVDVTIADDYIAALENGSYTVIVEFNKGNAVAVVLTVTA